MMRFRSPLALVQRRRPEHPVSCARPDRARRAARWFTDHFPGRVLFAVKTNPSPWALDAVYAGGVRHFDVASLVEIQTVARRFPDARLSYMHPVKPEAAIRRAYHEFGVRDFSFDCEAELDKILRATDGAEDLGLFLRFAVDNEHSQMKLHTKFGAAPDDAVALLRRTRSVARTLGATFHVGSQTMDPVAYVHAMDVVATVIRRAGVIVDVLDVGGGFPAAYPGMMPPPLARFVEAIEERFEEMPVAETCEIWCEPGRALVADSASLVVQVDLRKGGALYINDGTYGGLFDAGTPGFVYPARLLRGESIMGPLAPFSLFGPTCDSIDTMNGPFLLPDTVREGDYIEFGMLGAYCGSLRTDFNGFGYQETAFVDDVGPVLADLYEPARTRPDRYAVQSVPEPGAEMAEEPSVERVTASMGQRASRSGLSPRRPSARARARRGGVTFRHRDPGT